MRASLGARLQQDQNVLLVYFLGDKVDGLFWFSNHIEGGLK